ncbi:MAG: hypothetical protein ABSC94_32240 [Polyangiaceae bacterium]|jgi:hypothetical protein
MTSFRAPGLTPGGSRVDLLFHAALGCSLQLIVVSGLAELADSPQTCTIDGQPTDRLFRIADLINADPR